VGVLQPVLGKSDPVGARRLGWWIPGTLPRRPPDVGIIQRPPDFNTINMLRILARKLASPVLRRIDARIIKMMEGASASTADELQSRVAALEQQLKEAIIKIEQRRFLPQPPFTLAGPPGEFMRFSTPSAAMASLLAGMNRSNCVSVLRTSQTRKRTRCSCIH
jgi:hypothetical protein